MKKSSLKSIAVFALVISSFAIQAAGSSKQNPPQAGQYSISNIVALINNALDL